MPLRDKTEELRRLIRAFETESAKFHPLTLSLLYVTQDGLSFNRPLARPNYAIMLWQYRGAIESESDAAHLVKNISESDLQWGVCGADVTCCGILEGEGCELFLRMARRAGSLFDHDEASALKVRVVEELLASEQKRHAPAKPVAGSNDDPLALWLN